MSGLTDPGLDPLFWPNLRPTAASAWHGHVPFAHWLVATTRPGMIVELGTHAGASYAAFCQAVAREKLATKCFAVDTWRGDDHAGAYSEEVFTDLAAFNAAHFAGFSRLLRTSFDEAAIGFAPGSVDLLHIDGFHSYQAVSHDFETWRSKLSPRAVVLFHDIAVRERGFGVWRFWEEITRQHPHFSFAHAYGLGVLAVGADIPPAVAQLCASTGADAERIRTRFAVTGALHEVTFAHSLAPAAAIAEEAPSAVPPPSDDSLDIGDIFIAERFVGPAQLCTLDLPRDALTRGSAGCAVWITTMDGQDWRQGSVVVQPEGGVLSLAFPAFANAEPRHFHLFVTGPCAAGAGLPPRLVELLASRRAPIQLAAPQIVLALPAQPARRLYLVQDEAILEDNREPAA